jgi:hypothetical protein
MRLSYNVSVAQNRLSYFHNSVQEFSTKSCGAGVFSKISAQCQSYFTERVNDFIPTLSIFVDRFWRNSV